VVDSQAPSWPIAFHPFDRLDGKVHAREIINPGAATMIVRKGMRAQLSAALQERFSVSLPEGPSCVSHDGVTIISTAPGAWLGCKDEGGYAWAAELAATTAGLASVADQSSSSVVVRIAGEKSGEVLQKGVFIDLHPGVFTAGSAVLTVIAHISVILWRPRADGPYYVAIPRSYAGSFQHWLEAAALT
jgi:sarcosine oxidase subunit gamma